MSEQANLESLDIIKQDIVNVDNRIKLTEKSLSTIELTDYPTISSMTSVLNRMQGEKTALIKLKYSIEQDLRYKNEETQVKINKIKAEIDRLAQGGDLTKIDELILSLHDLAGGVDVDERDESTSEGVLE